jgi:hypothetical protein
MTRAEQPVDLPVLRVDPAVWEHNGEAEQGSRLTARLQLGELTLRLEARALDSGAAHDLDGPQAHAQITQIGTRSYMVVGYAEDRARELVAV